MKREHVYEPLAQRDILAEARREAREAVRALRAEIVETRKDAARADERGFRRLAADLRDRVTRLESLAQVLADFASMGLA